MNLFAQQLKLKKEKHETHLKNTQHRQHQHGKIHLEHNTDIVLKIKSEQKHSQCNMVHLTLVLFIDKKAKRKTKFQSHTVMIRMFAFVRKCVKTSGSCKLLTAKFLVSILRSGLEFSL